MAKKAKDAKRRGNNQGSVRLRKDGKTWEGVYTTTDKDGKKVRRSVYGKSEKEVETKLKLAIADSIKGNNLDPDSITLEQWAELWIKDFLPEARDSTKFKYAQDLRLYVYPVMGSSRLQKITKPMVQRLISKMLEDGKSPKTCKNVHGVLHHMFEDAISSEYILTNPAQGTKLPKITKKEMNVLSDGSFVDFLNEIKGKPFENIFYIATFTGMREGELLGLTWDNVDMKGNKITVVQQLKRDSKIGQKSSQYILADTKTGNHRTLIVDPSVMRRIRREQVKQMENRLKLGQEYNNELNLVFTNEYGHYINPRTLLKHFKKRLAAVNLPLTMRIHDLRHTFATQSFRNGDSVVEVQTNLGHTQPSTTLNVYAHCTEEMKVNSARRMSNFIESLNIDEAM